MRKNKTKNSKLFLIAQPWESTHNAGSEWNPCVHMCGMKSMTIFKFLFLESAKQELLILL